MDTRRVDDFDALFFTEVFNRLQTNIYILDAETETIVYMNDAMKKKYGVRSQLLHSWKLVMPDKLPEPLDYLSGKEMLAGLPDQFARVLKGEGIRIPG